MCQICAELRPYDKSCAMAEFAGTTVDILRATIREGTRDAPAGTSTPYRMAPGDVFDGTVASAGDNDWIAIRLEAGKTYQFELNGMGLADPLLHVHDAQGRAIASDDDGGVGLNSRVILSPSQTGTYYLNATAYGGATGAYQLTATEQRPPQAAPIAELATYLTNGYWADNGVSSRAFDTSGSNVITYDITALDAAGRALATDAMQAWSAIANIRFVQSRTAAQIVFDDNQSGAFANSTLSGDRILRSTVNVDRGWLDLDGTRIGTYSFQTYMHEIGHALGLGHQGDYNGSGSFSSDARFANDSWQASIMSYFSPEDNPYVHATWDYAATLMPADIIAIQRLYGVAGSGTLTAGNTTYGVGHTLGTSWLGRVFSAQNGTAHPTVQDARSVAITIHDSSGIDTLNFGNDGQAQRVDLRGGASSDIYGLRGNLQISQGTVVEVFVAGTGNDVVQGNAASNKLHGMRGNDSLTGHAGDDTLTGGSGNDTLSGSAGQDYLYGQDGNDLLTDSLGHNFLSGGAGNDVLTAGVGNDTVAGDLGNDSLQGGAGNDSLYGGDGQDTIRGGLGHDRIDGGTGHDYLEAGAGNDRLMGQLGNDIMIGGLGADTMSGGSGTDTFRFFAVGDSLRTASDLITDFGVGDDVLDLRSFNLDRAGGVAVSGTRTVTWDHIDGATRVLIDTNGDRLPDMMIRMTGRLDLDADHFIL